MDGGQGLAGQTVERLAALEQDPFLKFHDLVQGQRLEAEIVVVKLLDNTKQVVGATASGTSSGSARVRRMWLL